MPKSFKRSSKYKKKTVYVKPKKSGKGKHKGYKKTVWVKKKK